MEQEWYPLLGHLAVNYGNGEHPKHRQMNYHRFFSERISETETVLDIGCGIGAVAYRVAEETGAQVIGVDLDSQKILQAQQQYQHPNVSYHLGDAREFTLLTHVDVVVLSNVLEHLEARPAFLTSLCNSLNPDRLLIRVPLFERDWRVPMKQELGLDWRLDETHFTEYTLESFQEEMKAANLHINYLEVRWGEIWTEVTLADFDHVFHSDKKAFSCPLP